MKFNDLYNRVFVSEQENTEVAHPDDFNDVEPIPVPEAPVEADPAAPAPVSTGLNDYITQCNELADKLQSPSEACLQSLVATLDKPLTPFEGISNLKSDVEKSASTLRNLAGRLLSYTIAAAKQK